MLKLPEIKWRQVEGWLIDNGWSLDKELCTDEFIWWVRPYGISERRVKTPTPTNTTYYFEYFLKDHSPSYYFDQLSREDVIRQIHAVGRWGWPEEKSINPRIITIFSGTDDILQRVCLTNGEEQKFLRDFAHKELGYLGEFFSDLDAAFEESGDYWYRVTYLEDVPLAFEVE